jgi:hypothetical protein
LEGDGKPIEKLEFDVREGGPAGQNLVWNISYGWPLLWRQYVFEGGYGVFVHGWRYSASRLAGNLAIWLVILAASAAICEWFMRRYRPKLRWSLRAMLGVVALAAALCAWYAAARDRVKLEDSLIAEIKAWGGVWVECQGPDWLDLIGADRLRRRLVAVNLEYASMNGDNSRDEEVQQLLERLHRFRKLRYLFLRVENLTPDIARALADLRELETLSLEFEYWKPGAADALAKALAGMQQLTALSIDAARTCNGTATISHTCMPAIGRLTQLEDLHLEGMEIVSDDLACLAGLENLKSLSLADLGCFEGPDSQGALLLSRLPALPRLEALDLMSSHIGEGDLPHLASVPNLKSLGLSNTGVSAAGLRELARLPSLEELTIFGETTTPAALHALQSLQRLKTLHINWNQGPAAVLALDRGSELRVPAEELESWRRALAAFRRSRLGIVVDSQTHYLPWSTYRWDFARSSDGFLGRPGQPSSYERFPDSFRSEVRDVLRKYRPSTGPK